MRLDFRHFVHRHRPRVAANPVRTAAPLQFVAMLRQRWYGPWLTLAATCALVSLLGACGQKGPLYIPNTPEAAQRATLPQTLFGTAQKDRQHDAESDGDVVPTTPPAKP
jgi:predicted small lipoprotein YifL